MNDIPTYILNSKQVIENNLRVRKERKQQLDGELEDIKEEIRGLEKALEDLCPLICKTCLRGAWDPHRHQYEVRRNKWKYYVADRIPRPESV